LKEKISNSGLRQKWSAFCKNDKITITATAFG